TRVPIRRMEMSRPGELIHVDIKKLGRIPKGGGWRAHGRAARPSTTATKTRAIGYAFVHPAVAGYSRLAYYAVLPHAQAVPPAALHRDNQHRHHTAIGGPPTSRVSNLAGSYN